MPKPSLKTDSVREKGELMTYIEFFDSNATKNVCACLTFTPDRVIYVGDNGKLMKRHISNYQRVFAQRGKYIEFFYKTVSKSNLDHSVAMLTELVETYDDCVFDITGGSEMLNLALGIVYSRYPEKNIQIHKINLRNGSVYDCDKDGTTIFHEPPALSVAENIRIYGGDVVYGTIEEGNTYLWNLTREFRDDAQRMWDICKQNVRYWNMQIGTFETIEKLGKQSEDGLTTTASRAAVENYLERHRLKYKKATGIINYLLKHGLLKWFSDEDDITVTYKDPQVKKCLTTAGQILEMKVYLTAKNVTEKDGTPVYHDCVNGVVIDWDGEFHNEETENIYDTENEIDVLLMHGAVPVFVSCKNGIVTPEELYKLNSVAERFGGEYAKKILVATALNTLGETGNYLRQRAEDMHIRIVENIQQMDEEELARKFRSFWSQ
jgi:hypothetical protein